MPGPAALSFTSGGRQVGVEHFPAPVSGPQPAVLLLHGADGLKAGRHYQLAAQVVAAAGYHAFLLHYLDRTGERRASYSHIGLNFPAWAETVGEALTFVQHRSGIDPNRPVLIGSSLGGRLALVLPQKMIACSLWSPISVFCPMWSAIRPTVCHRAL